MSLIDLSSLGLALLLLLALLATLLLPSIGGNEPASLRKCRNKLKNIGLALAQYSDDHRFFPHMAAITEDASQAMGEQPLRRFEGLSHAPLHEAHR